MGLEYQSRTIGLTKNQQKEPGFLALNPNGQRLMFQVGGIGPMTGQAGYFAVFSKEKIPSAEQRCTRANRGLLEILNARLGKTE